MTSLDSKFGRVRLSAGSSAPHWLWKLFLVVSRHVAFCLFRRWQAMTWDHFTCHAKKHHRPTLGWMELEARAYARPEVAAASVRQTTTCSSPNARHLDADTCLRLTQAGSLSPERSLIFYPHAKKYSVWPYTVALCRAGAVLENPARRFPPSRR